ncbi:5-oxoprolinase subunit PxpB [Bacillus sp. CECT 9360]|uniref:5-oxoprolinase subunit PxpB n=1 Tax=Bacillus sp. CECT 9360 TaxID=2845821 RepID=UPI001E3182DC|nr:5-oxoprolinase subunit PxpB [Bacillus sp. CECT 9360]CAH0344330.1 5-oxoprolinase subunit B [Bacillus sp. CECT 9360]
MEYSFHRLGDNAVIIEIGKDISIETQQKVQVITSFLDEHPPPWMIEYIPAFTTVTVFYEPVRILAVREESLSPYQYVCNLLRELFSGLTAGRSVESRIVDIPVCYGGEFGPDLEYVARINGLTTEEVIHIHSSGDYLVYMIGFAPGFPYIGGMSEEIATPRKESPRLQIPARTVGIAGKQTGIYPIETPGGWQLIGRTPVRLFRPENEAPSLLRAGDKIRFLPISRKEYIEWEND